MQSILFAESYVHTMINISLKFCWLEMFHIFMLSSFSYITLQLYKKLSNEELQMFAALVKKWRNNSISFPEFCDKILELYGPPRKHLLAGNII